MRTSPLFVRSNLIGVTFIFVMIMMWEGTTFDSMKFKF